MCAALREVHVKWAASYSRPLWPLLHEMRRQVCMCVFCSLIPEMDSEVTASFCLE